MDYKLIIFDKDGTIARNKNNHSNFINKLGEQEMIPGVVERCAELREQGIQLAVASNQGGVAFGFMTVAAATSIVHAAGYDIGAESLFVMFEVKHPEATIEQFKDDSYFRKPNPGMLFMHMMRAKTLPAETLMVGDRDDDYFAAKNAGCDFQWAHEFFGWDAPD